MAKGKSGAAKKSTAPKKEKKEKTEKGIKRTKAMRGNRTRKTFNKAIKAISKKAIGSRGVKVLNSFAWDMLERIANASANVARAIGKKTVSAAAVTQAVRIVLPAELARHATSEASKAVSQYVKSAPKPKKSDKPKAPKKAKASKKTAKK